MLVSNLAIFSLVIFFGGCSKNRGNGSVETKQTDEAAIGTSLGKPPVAKQAEVEFPKHSTPTTFPFAFEECAHERGLDFTYRNGEENQQFAVLENLGGGVGIVDFNNDGWPDIVLAGGGALSDDGYIASKPFGLFANNQGHFCPVIKAANFNPLENYSHGVCALDFNNDGFQDLLMTGFEGASLLENMGDGTFVEVGGHIFNLLNGICTSAAAGDLNRDGISDIYITTYVDWSPNNHPFCTAPDGAKRELCSPKDFSGTADYLFYGTGDGSFVQAAELAGLKEKGKGLGVMILDLDRDGDLDIYVANDTTNNFLYLNAGSGNFVESGVISGVALDERALPNGSMGLTACDVNNDLELDLWVTNYERETFALYRNDGNGTFMHSSRRHGIAALGGLYVGFGTDWEDFDLDGVEEIVVTNGHVLRFPTGAPRRQEALLLTRHDDRFHIEQFPDSSYFSGDYEGRGLAVGDLDRDGMSDIVITHLNEPVALLCNRSLPKGHQLRIKLVGTKSTRNAEGAIVELSTKSGKRMQTLVGGGSYLSQNQLVVTFGIPGDQRVDELFVYWPSGTVQRVVVDDAASCLTFIEP